MHAKSSEARRPHPAPSPRGVTLMEVMITVSIIGIIAAIATPNLAPILNRSKLAGAADAAAAFLDEAQRLARATGLCHGVRKTSDNVLEMWRRKHADCVDLENDTPNSDWDTLRVFRAEPGVELSIETTATPAVVANQIVFRPNGRYFGDGDLQIADDAARLVVKHGSVPDRAHAIFVTTTGRMCHVRYKGATLPQTFTASSRCPG